MNGSPAQDHRTIFRDFSEASDRVLYGRQALPAGEPPVSSGAPPESPSEVLEAEVVAAPAEPTIAPPAELAPEPLPEEKEPPLG